MKQLPVQTEPTALSKAAQVSTVVIAAAAAIALLYYLKPIFLPLTLACFLYFFSYPVVRGLRVRYRIPEWASQTVFIVLMLVGLLTLTYYPIFSLGDQLLSDMKMYERKLNALIAAISSELRSKEISVMSSELKGAVLNVPLQPYLEQLAGHLGSFLTSLSLIFLFYIFLCMGQVERFTTLSFYREIEKPLMRYIFIKFVISAGVSVAVGVVLSLLEVEAAPILALMTFILNFVPNIGPIIGTVILVPVALFYWEEPMRVAAIVLIPGSIHFVLGNIVEPKWQGDCLDMNPVMVMVALMFWGILWGPGGVFLSIPLTVAVQIICRRYEATKWFAQILQGKMAARCIYASDLVPNDYPDRPAA